jgi:large conductance mechanosensitive channel
MLKGEFWKEFGEFIQEYKIISVGVAFVMGQAINELVKSFVSNMFMPLLNPLIPEGTWKTATLNIWLFEFGWGPFISSLLHFSILSFIVFLLVKKLLRIKKQ